MVYIGWCLHQMCKTLFLQMSHLKSFSAENISFLGISLYLFIHAAFEMFTKKLSVAVKSPCSLIYAM